jgi:hypothetical protein
MKRVFTTVFSATSILTISLSFLLCSCIFAPPEERAIKKYLKETLNDPKSYEPIDFKTLSFEEDFYLLGIDFWQYSSTMLSFWNEMNSLVVKLCVVEDKSMQSDAMALWDSVKAILDYKTVDYLNYDSVSELVSYCSMKTSELLIRAIRTRETVGTLAYYEIRKGSPKFSEAFKAYEEVADEIRQKIQDLCIPLSQVKQAFDAGRILFHSFRANNSFGALILTQSVFILNSGKTEVECNIDLD